MKITTILSFLPSFLLAAMFLAGCASSPSSSSSPSASGPEEAASMGSDEASTSSSSAKTAYDGSTGSGLLMERYKQGQIGGYRN